MSLVVKPARERPALCTQLALCLTWDTLTLAAGQGTAGHVVLQQKGSPHRPRGCTITATFLYQSNISILTPL